MMNSVLSPSVSVGWHPVSALDRMFDDVMGASFGTATNPRTFVPEYDVRVRETEVVIAFDVPGLKREDLEMTVEDRVLTIRGVRKFEGEQTDQVVLGRAYGEFTRSFTLPQTLDDENVTASLEDGVLTVRIPKHPKAKPRKILIGETSALTG